jgi:hypothetical protein
VLPYYELRTKLGLEGKTVQQIAEGVQAAYAKGEIPKRPEVLGVSPMTCLRHRAVSDTRRKAWL